MWRIYYFVKIYWNQAWIQFFIEESIFINIEVDTNLFPRKYLTE